jgi:hypothetical protein
MSAPQSKAHRLLTALERLVEEEAIHAREGDLAAVIATQDRIEAILVALGSLAAGSVGFSQIAPLLERRDETRHEIGRRARAVRCELDRVRAGKRRLRELAPAYAGPAEKRPRFLSEA